MNKFKVAFLGLISSFNDKAIRIQWILALVVLIVAAIFEIHYYDWIIIIFLISMVLSFEIINTAIEKTCDLYSKEYNKDIKIIKDLSAGAVLLVSLVSALIGIMIFIRYL